jgi:hypothetical protein
MGAYKGYVYDRHLKAIDAFEKSTFKLSQAIENKANQESDIHLASWNHKMGKFDERDYHAHRAVMRGELRSKREQKELERDEDIDMTANNEDEDDNKRVYCQK